MYHDLLGRRMPLWFALKDDEFVGGKRWFVDRLFGQKFRSQTPVDTKAVEPWLVPGSAAHRLGTAGGFAERAAAKYISSNIPRQRIPCRMISVDSQKSHGQRNTGMLDADPILALYATASPAENQNSSCMRWRWIRRIKYGSWTIARRAFCNSIEEQRVHDYHSSIVGRFRKWGHITNASFSNGNVGIGRAEISAGSANQEDYSTRYRASDPFDWRYGEGHGGSPLEWGTSSQNWIRLRENLFRPTSDGSIGPAWNGMDAEGTCGWPPGGKLKKWTQTGKVSSRLPMADSGPYSVTGYKTKSDLVQRSFHGQDRALDPSNNTLLSFTAERRLDVRAEVDRSQMNPCGGRRSRQ
jgi:hypothetical protein